eukprot:5953416-Pyramimonas_sp.AAC.1
MMSNEARGLELAGASSAIKYSGLYICPGAAGVAWSAPLSKFVARCAMLRQLAPGCAMTVSTFLVICLSVLQFVIQVEPVPKQVMQIYKHMLQCLTNGPYNAFSYNMLVSLQKLGFSVEPPDLVALSRARRARLA